MRKTTVTITKYEDGSGSIVGDCEICGQFPCEHATEQGYFASDTTLKINTIEELRTLKDALDFLKEQTQSGPMNEGDKRLVHVVKFLLGELDKLKEPEYP